MDSCAVVNIGVAWVHVIEMLGT